MEVGGRGEVGGRDEWAAKAAKTAAKWAASLLLSVFSFRFRKFRFQTRDAFELSSSSKVCIFVSQVGSSKFDKKFANFFGQKILLKKRIIFSF